MPSYLPSGLPGDVPKVSVRSIEDLLDLVPYLVGYVPDRRLVVLGLANGSDGTGGDGGRVVVSACVPLPGPGADYAEISRDLLSKLVRTPVTGAFLVAYGDGPDATPLVDAVRAESTAMGLAVRGALRVREGRYWSYLDTDPWLCSPEGNPYDAGRSTAATRAISAGIAPYSSRSAIAETIAPVTGPARAAMREATAIAEELIGDARTIGAERAARDLREATRRVLPKAADRYATGGVLDDVQAAVLAVALTDPHTQDRAISLAAYGDTGAYVAMWTDLARRVEPGYRVPVLTLLAFAAWRDGGGALPNIATDEALRADPACTLAQLMRTLLDLGVHGPTFDVPEPDEFADQ